MDSLSHEIELQKKEADYHRVRYEELKLSRDKKRKERELRHKEEMTALSNEIIRLHDELYNLRISEKIT